MERLIYFKLAQIKFIYMPEINGINFDNVINAVEDLGADPEGNEPIDNLISSAVQEGTLIQFPPGTYRVRDEYIIDEEVSRFGLEGTGESHEDVEFIFPQTGHQEGHWFVNMDARDGDDFKDVILRNFTLNNEFNGENSVISVRLKGTDNCILEDIEFAGFLPEKIGDAYGQLVDIGCTTVDGVNIARRVIIGRDGSYMHGHNYITGHAGVTAFRFYPDHVGESRLENIRIHQLKSVGVRNTLGPGVVNVRGGLFHNICMYALRIHEGDHPNKKATIEGATVVIDHDNLGRTEGNPGNSHAHSGIFLDSNRGYSYADVIDCDIACYSITDGAEEGWGLVRLTTTGASNVGGTDFKNCRIINETELRTVWIQGRESDAGGQDTVNFQDTEITTTSNSQYRENAVVWYHDNADNTWDGSKFENCCINAPNGNLDGVLTENTENFEVVNTTINVSGQSVVANGGGFSTKDFSTSGTCEKPGLNLQELRDNIDSTAYGGSRGNRTLNASVEGKIEKLDDDSKSAVFGKAAVGQLDSEKDVYSIQGRIEDFYIDQPVKIRVDGEEISGQEFIRRFVKCEEVTGSTDDSTTDSGSGSGSDLAGSVPEGATLERANEDYETIELDSDRQFNVGEGETFSNKLIIANGNQVTIRGDTSDWEIKNIGIKKLRGERGHIEAFVNDPDGEALVENVYIEDTTNNIMFVNRIHEGHLTVRRCSFIYNGNPGDLREDGIYGSPPGNVPPKDGNGYGGTIDVVDCYFERMDSHGVRLGSVGSRCINCTLVDCGKSLTNYYGGPESRQYYEGNREADRDYVLFKDIDVGGESSFGLQVGSHYQKEDMDIPVAVKVENLSIADSVERPTWFFTSTKDGTHHPIINGEEVKEKEPDISNLEGFNNDVDLNPPRAAPMTPEEAASGGYRIQNIQ